VLCPHKETKMDKRYIKVKVTLENIILGERQNGHNCPIQHALTCMGFHAVKVPWNGEKGVIRISDPITNLRYEWDIPPVAFKWLVQFDRGEEVKPFQFVLDLDKAVTKPMLRGKTVDSTKTAQPRVKRTIKHKGLRPITFM